MEYIGNSTFAYYSNAKIVAKRYVWTVVFTALTLVFAFIIYPKIIQANSEKNLNWIRIVVCIIFSLIAAGSLADGIYQSVVFKHKKEILKNGKLMLCPCSISIREKSLQNEYGQTTYSEHILKFVYYTSSSRGTELENHVTQRISSSTYFLLESRSKILKGCLPVRKYLREVVLDEKALCEIEARRLDYKTLPVLEAEEKPSRSSDASSQASAPKVEQKDSATAALLKSSHEFVAKNKYAIEKLQDSFEGYSVDDAKFSKDDDKFVQDMYDRLRRGGKVLYSKEEVDRIWDLVDNGHDDSTRLMVVGGFLLYANGSVHGALDALWKAGRFHEPLAMRIIGVIFDENKTLAKDIANRRIAAICYCASLYYSNAKAIDISAIKPFNDLVKKDDEQLTHLFGCAYASWALNRKNYDSIYEFYSYLKDKDENQAFLIEMFLATKNATLKEQLLKEKPYLEGPLTSDFGDVARMVIYTHYISYTWRTILNEVEEAVKSAIERYKHK